MRNYSTPRRLLFAMYCTSTIYNYTVETHFILSILSTLVCVCEVGENLEGRGKVGGGGGKEEG